MKKYISADLRVINCANDIIATSGFDSANNTQGFSGREGGFAPSRGMWEDDEYDF